MGLETGWLLAASSQPLLYCKGSPHESIPTSESLLTFTAPFTITTHYLASPCEKEKHTGWVKMCRNDPVREQARVKEMLHSGRQARSTQRHHQSSALLDVAAGCLTGTGFMTTFRDTCTAAPVCSTEQHTSVALRTWSPGHTYRCAHSQAVESNASLSAHLGARRDITKCMQPPNPLGADELILPSVEDNGLTWTQPRCRLGNTDSKAGAFSHYTTLPLARATCPPSFEISRDGDRGSYTWKEIYKQKL